MKTWSFLAWTLLTLIALDVSENFARRTHLTAEQKTDSAKPALTVNSLDVDVIGVDINASQTTATAVDITADAITTGIGMSISADNLTTGPALSIDSDSDSFAKINFDEI